MDISVIIPNYNGEKLLRKNIPKLLGILKDYKDKFGIEVIIVDDCSKDGSVDYINSMADFSSPGILIKLVTNSKNLGFSSSMNRGALEAKGELLVFLNTDIAPETGFLDPVVEDFKKDKSLFGVGFMDKSQEGEETVLRGRGIARWSRGFLIHSRGEVDKSDTFWISGGSSAVRKSIFDQLGGFDDLYNPFYWEDIDLSYRACKSGHKILFEKKSVVFHRHEEGAIKTYYSKFWIKTIAYKNQFIFIWKNITDFDFILSHLFWLPYHFLKSLLRLDFAFFSGFFLALARFPDIMRKRFSKKKIFIKEDGEILSS